MEIGSDIRQDGDRLALRFARLQYVHNTPKAPFDLALRCEAVSNVPQIEFEQDDVWHDFAPKAAPDLLRRRRSMRS
jgi:hypothetical protein